MSVCNKIIKRVFIVVITGNPAFQVTCRVECSLSPLPVEMQIANIFLGRRFSRSSFSRSSFSRSSLSRSSLSRLSFSRSSFSR